MHIGPTGIAAAGFALAALSLGWQLWYAVRIDRARLGVRVASMIIFSHGTASLPVITSTVTNTGRRATVLQSAHITLGRHGLADRLWPAQYRPKAWRGTKSILPFASTDLPLLNSNTVLPKRLEPGDEVTTYVRREHVEKALRIQGVDRLHVVASASTARTRASRSIRLDLGPRSGGLESSGVR